MNFTSLFFIPLILLSCGTKTPVVKNEIKDTVKVDSSVTKPNNPVLDMIVKVGDVPVLIKSPEVEIKADILVLPGWNFEKEKICNESDFCTKALEKGYRLILPEMMKSVYASQYYPETRSDYKKFLTLTWVTDTMIPKLQRNYGIFTGKKNYIHGISTGSRGAALVHLKTGTLFTKVVLLSGDYNNGELSDDNLLKNTYGPYDQFKDRWIANDNPWELSLTWSADLYIAHGTNDDVVPVEQSQRFADKIKKEHPQIKFVSNFPDAKHDFKFWGGETEAILDFFD
jgi:esterase/lipase superfamily enzyme